MSSTARNAVIGLSAALIAVLLVASGFLVRVVTESDSDGGSSARTTEDGGALLEEETRQSDGDFDGDLLAEIARVLEQDFVDETRVDPELLRDGAIQGIFEALNDPHSTYIDPQTYSLSRDDFEGAFQGIGATVSKQENYVVIVQPIPDTPAARAGLRAGDIILAVDGENAENWSVEQAVLEIRGPSGSSVDITVRHNDGTEETLTIVRDNIPVSSVTTTPPTGQLTDEAGEPAEEFGYVRILQFSRNTPQELEDAIRAAVEAGAQGLIIDVRSNPGGLLQETVEIADMFLDEGVIVTQVDRDGNERTASAREGQITDLPIVIIQDEFSASGSELFAAALQEHDRARVVGTRSFGKGTVNHAVELSNGGAVYVSIARWLTPDGNQIEGRGITPDVPVALTLEDIDAQRDVSIFRALNILRGEPLPEPPPATETAEATGTPGATETATATPTP
ncbi:MAG: S41 family peptidase [Dehalococcoidia bacterium]|nr:S41 family peptidase [Dehalococcoidia bacterium]